MKRVLYVDFENVSSAGLNGVLKLTKNDEVKIFLGPKCSKMSLIEAESILHCDATVELIKNDQIGKNALDFIIMVHLGYDIAKREGDAFFIISNDKGYEPAIHEMQSKTGETIERYPDIEHVIARKDEAPGLFARLFGKKKPVVENTTEHEVLKKGNRTGGGRSTSSRSGNGAGRSGNAAGSGSGRNGNSAGRSGSGARSGGNSAGGRNSNGRNANGSGADGRNASGRSTSGNRLNGSVGTGSRQNPNQNFAKLLAHEKPIAPEKKATVEVKNTAQVKNTPASAVNPAEQTNKPAAKPVAQVNTQTATSGAKPEMQANKPATTASTKPKAIVKSSTKPGTPITITTQDDSYLDNLSIADLRAQLNVTSAASTSGATPSAVAMKSEKNDSIKPTQAPKPAQPAAPKRPASVDMNDAERDLVARALAETDNLGDFHNYILKELHDNDRATEIYKSEKHKVGKNK